MNQQTQGVRDAALVLPFVATILLMPPVILIFAVPAQLGGIPLIAIYIFLAWAVVVASAFLIARRIAAPAPADSSDEADDERRGS